MHYFVGEIISLIKKNQLQLQSGCQRKTQNSITLIINKVKKTAENKIICFGRRWVHKDLGMYYPEKGDELKKFNNRDAKAFELLKSAGIKSAIIK